RAASCPSHARRGAQHARLQHPLQEYSFYYREISGHNVVIGTLLGAKTGNVFASHLAGQLFKPFPNIRIALLVGIGGGIPLDPPDRDPFKNIRLGDVVVGYPLDGSPSSIYYQYGRHGPQGREVLRKGRMEDPDFRVLSGVDKLFSDTEVNPGMVRQEFAEQLDRLRSREVHGPRFALPSQELLRTIPPANLQGMENITKAPVTRDPWNRARLPRKNTGHLIWLPRSGGAQKIGLPS
ncbi:hypothetical protein RB597_010094, partial [Gaeumannomyces tritici]